ncbi:hypothetical protein QF026_005005 [Streptomyces aurantiacus]|nr:hypothetical protein [Streptomyces aurantiacus]
MSALRQREPLFDEQGPLRGRRRLAGQAGRPPPPVGRDRVGGGHRGGLRLTEHRGLRRDGSCTGLPPAWPRQGNVVQRDSDPLSDRRRRHRSRGGSTKGARPEDPARYRQNSSSGPHQAVRLMPRLMQAVAEVRECLVKLTHPRLYASRSKTGGRPPSLPRRSRLVRWSPGSASGRADRRGWSGFSRPCRRAGGPGGSGAGPDRTTGSAGRSTPGRAGVRSPPCPGVVSQRSWLSAHPRSHRWR